MQWKMNRAGREIRICAPPVRATAANKEYRNCRWQLRKSEESIVPFEEQRQHNSEERDSTLSMQPKTKRIREIVHVTKKLPHMVRILQRKLYYKAKQK